MKELLCAGKYSEWDDFPTLKITFQGLFRFWWNRCVQQEEVADEFMEDIFPISPPSCSPQGKKIHKSSQSRP
jgi:hypothetical protein